MATPSNSLFVPPRPAGKAELRYNIVEELLTGTVGTTVIHTRAYSGGRAGSKTEGAVNPFLANNPYGTAHKLNKKAEGDSGGALPMGYYELQNHEHRPNWIRLNPDKGNVMHNRDGFAIHGRGPRGSDGCIVPADFNVVVQLYRLVKQYADNGLPRIRLEVFATGDLDRFERLHRTV